VTVTTTISHDEGLRTFMLGVFNRMGAATAASGITAWLWASMMGSLAGTWLGIFFVLLPLAFVLVLSFGINRLSMPMANLIFWSFAVCMGISLSTVFLTYTGASIAGTFLITAATFLSASLIGYTTRRDLTNMGTLLMVGLIGIIIAMLVNMWLASSALMFAISVIGVVVFVGLTMWDTQRLKHDYLSNGDVMGFDNPEKSALIGALGLYLNFVNLFQLLLNFAGEKES
jgi:uncharacterized protein